MTTKEKGQNANSDRQSNENVLSNSNTNSDIKPIIEAESNFFDELFQDREPIEYIYESIVPKGLPGGLFASGGSGKTFFCLQQAIYGSAGMTFGKLIPTKPLKTAFYCAEDQKRFLLERVEAIINANPELKSRLDLIKENCIIESLAGVDASFLKMENSSIIQTDFYKGFLDKLAKHNGFDWIGLDPLVSFWGLGENDAANGKELVRCLTEISMLTGASVQVSHHVSKSSTMESISTSGGRGTSAVYDGLRWGFGMTKMLPTVSVGGKEYKNKDLQKLRLLANEPDAQFVKLFSAKSNHAKEIPSIMTFKRGDRGQLEHFEVNRSTEESGEQMILKFVSNNADLTASQIYRQAIGSTLRTQLKEELGISGYRVGELIENLISTEQLIEKEIVSGKTTKKVLMLNAN